MQHSQMGVRQGQQVVLCPSICLGPALAYVPYWAGNVLLLGPRYWYEATPFLALLTARGAVALADALVGRVGDAGRIVVTALLAAGIGFSLFHFLPRQIAPLASYSDVEPKLRDRLAIADPGPALVLVRIDHFLSFNEAFALEDPFLQGRLLFARDRGAHANARLIAAFPGRRLLTWDGERLAPYRAPRSD